MNLEAAMVDVDLLRPSAEVVQLRIGDNAPGVPDEQKATIFGRGEKDFDSSGTRMGLYLGRKVVRSYGGWIWVENGEPARAIFVIELPAVDGKGAE